MSSQDDSPKYNPLPNSAFKGPFTHIDPRRRLNSARTSSRGSEFNIGSFMWGLCELYLSNFDLKSVQKWV